MIMKPSQFQFFSKPQPIISPQYSKFIKDAHRSEKGPYIVWIPSKLITNVNTAVAEENIL